jgi:hypothetical protein
MGDFIIDLVRACAWPSAFVIVAAMVLVTVLNVERACELAWRVRDTLFGLRSWRTPRGPVESSDWWTQT